MDRVKEIEKIFHPLSFFVIVHIQRDESQAGQRLPEKTETSCNGLFQRILIEDIEDDNQHNASPVIVCLKNPACENPCSCRKNGQERMDKTGFFHAPYRQKTQKQSKHYILVGKLQNTAVKGQVKGNF